jgi:hypothetical protein
MRGDPLARNIAEVIDDLYRQHAPPRDHQLLIALIQHQIEHVQWVMTRQLDEPNDLESLAEVKEQCEDLEAIVERHARTMAAYGLDFIDTGHIVIVDAKLANAGFALMLADLEEEARHG